MYKAQSGVSHKNSPRWHSCSLEGFRADCIQLCMCLFSRRGKLQRESDFMASVDSSWISWGVGVFILKPLKWTLSSVLGDSKIPEEEEVLIYVELLQVGGVENFLKVTHLQKGYE